MDFLAPGIEAYCVEHSAKEADILKELERQTRLKTIMPQMLSGRLQAQFLRFFVQACGARSILEVGTFTGYSALAMALAMPADSKLITLDINEELEELCRQFIAAAGMEQRIDYRLGNALDLLPGIEERFDLVFLDADKENYLNYFHLLYPKLKVGGWLLADNVLWSGKVLMSHTDRDTAAIQAYNRHLAQDPRMEVMILPLRDGVSIARKIA